MSHYGNEPTYEYPKTDDLDSDDKDRLLDMILDHLNLKIEKKIDHWPGDQPETSIKLVDKNSPEK